MRVDLKRVLRLVALAPIVFGMSASTAFCQAHFRAPISTITQRSFAQHSFAQHDFTQHASIHASLMEHSFTHDSLFASQRASSAVIHAAAVDFLRDSEGARQLPAFHFAAYKSNPSLEERFAVRTNDTVFVSQSRVPLAHFLGGRLQIAGFSSTVKMENVMLGPAAESAVQSLRLMQQARFSAAHSIDLYGVSVGFRLTPLAETAGRAPIWRVLQSIRE